MYDQVIVDIKDYVFRYEVTSPKAWKNARSALLDALGCGIETVHKSEDFKRMFGPWVIGTQVPCGFRLPGTGYSLDPLKGAFDLSTAIRYLDHNDAIAGADWGHPSDNLGAILAVSDWLCRSSREGRITHTGPPLTMRTILTALIKAYEIQGCMLLRNAFNAHGLDHVILVKLASTAVVAWLLGLTEEQTMAAISHVWMDGQALRVYRQAGNTIPRKGWAAGDASMKAVQLALLTKFGQPGSGTPLTMPKWGFYEASFGKKQFELPKPYGSWVIENIIFKVMPVEGHGISSVQASLIHLQDIRKRGLSPEKDISQIRIRANAATKLIIDKKAPLANAADRDHCIQYLVALTLLKGEAPQATDFLDSSLWANSTAMEALVKRIEVTEDGALTRDYMDLDTKSLGAGVTIELTDGSKLEEILIHFPVGHGKNDGTAAAVKEKFHRNISLMFSPAEEDAITAMVESDASLDAEISDLLDLLVREGGPARSML